MKPEPFVLEVLGVLRQSHLDDIESVVVVLLSREQQGQQMEGVDIVSLKLQRLADIAQRLGDLPAHTYTKHRFSPQLQQKAP